jgi:hypothetical protein
MLNKYNKFYLDKKNIINLLFTKPSLLQIKNKY